MSTSSILGRSVVERAKVESDEGWRKLVPRIPFLTFRSDWQVRIIPPFSFAQVRFQVLLPSGTVKSVYLDSLHTCGMWRTDEQGNPVPYWEVYPYHGDVGRCDIDDTTMLMELIQDETEEEGDQECEKTM